MKRKIQPTPAPAPHPMRPFYTDPDGKVFERRTDITLREWRIYTDSEITLRIQEQYFVALFMGRVEPITLDLPWSQRLAQSVEALDDLTFEQYFAIRDTLFLDIVNPASPSPKAEASQSE